MDEMKLKLSTRLMRGMVAKILSKVLSKKLECSIDIRLHAIDIEMIDDKVLLHADVDGELSKEDFVKLIKSINLD